MNGLDVLADAFDRIRSDVHGAVDGLDTEALAWRADEDANSVAWLVWHLSRVQDDHVAEAAGSEQIWLSDGWADRFALPFDRRSIGFGHRSSDVAAVTVSSGDLLTGYHDAVHDRTLDYLRTLDDAALDRVLDEAWDPPVTLGVRLVSVVNDGTQHAGQAAFVAGLVQRAAR